jgi:hypothetical protein
MDQGENEMKKTLVLIPIVALLAACGTTDPYANRAREERKFTQEANERAIAKMPDWMSKLPISNNALFAAASGRADTPGMAIQMARTNAMADLCYGIDGRVDSQTKNFATANTKSSSFESVTRTRCNTVDVTGMETYGAKGIDKNPVVIATGTDFTAYVLIALPTGDANVLRKAKEQDKREQRQAGRAVEAFKELDKP